jgi:hypothetical protein
MTISPIKIAIALTVNFVLTLAIFLPLAGWHFFKALTFALAGAALIQILIEEVHARIRARWSV